MTYKVYIWGEEGETIVYVDANSEMNACEQANNMISIFAEPVDEDEEDVD